MAELNTALTPMMDLSAYKAIGASKSRRVTVQADNVQTFQSTASLQDVFFSIPSSRNSMINGAGSYLSFDVTVNATFTTDPVITLSNGSGCAFIRGLETIIQNQSVEVVDRYNVFGAVQDDLVSAGRSLTVGSIVNGTSTSIKTGVKLNSATTATDGAVIRVCLPVYSGVLGVLAQQFCPAVDGIRQRFTFEATDTALTYTNTTDVTTVFYKVSNIALQLEYIDLMPSVFAQLVSESGGVLKVHGTAINNYQTTTAISSSQSLLIPARYSSVKSLLTTFRLTSNLTSPKLENSIGDRAFPYIKDYNFVIDGRNIPAVPVRCSNSSSSGQQFGGEVFSELMKVFGGTHAPTFDCVFTATNYLEATGTAGTGAFVLGLDFEEDQAGHAIISGIDTNSSNIYLNMNQHTTSLALTVDTFAMYDIICSFDVQNGTMSLSK